MTYRTLSRNAGLAVAVAVTFVVAWGLAAGAAELAAKSSTAPSSQSAGDLTLDLGGGAAMKLVKIPAGRFMMGSPDTEKARSTDEGPQHEVSISKEFFMGIYPVTQAQYRQIMGDNPSVSPKGPTYPVEGVRWEMAVQFCRKMSEKTGRTVRLPTEAEFEYATRAGTTTRYHYGDDPDYKQLGDYAWWAGNAKDDIHPVGQKKPNAWGLYDVYSNVWQWCSDWYGDTYAGEKQTDPKGPVDGKYHVLRGGCWLVGAHAKDDKIGRMHSRSALRGTPIYYKWDIFGPGMGANLDRGFTQTCSIGFRVVVEEK